MYQIDNSTAAAIIPASTAPGTAGFFTDGNPATGTAPTILPAEFLNMLMMEMLGVLSAASVAPSKSAFSQLTLAIRGLIQSGTALYALDTGTANVYTVAFAPIVTALVDGMVLKFKAKTANTGASTFSPNGLAAKPLVGSAHSALQGGEIVANSDAWVQWNSAVGAGSWVLIDSTGGALQVAPATQSQHAIQLGQAVGRLIGVQVFAANGTYTPTVGTTSVVVEVQGGGGGSGGTPATGTGVTALSGAGASGSYAKARYTSAFSGVAVTVGLGGTPGGVNGNGGNGGTSSFGALVNCPGGGGSPAGAASAGAANANAGALAGAPSGSGLLTSARGAGNNQAIQVTSGIVTGVASSPAPIGGSSAGLGAYGIFVLANFAAQPGTVGNSGIVIVWEYA